MQFNEVKTNLDLPPKIYAQYLKAASKQFADDMPECAGWFMVKVPVRREHKIYDRLILAGLDAWLPETTETKIKSAGRKEKNRKRKKIVEEERVLIFDGHVLVRFCPFPETYHAIMGILGVQAIFANPMAFASQDVERRLESALSPHVVARLRELELENHEAPAPPQFKAGQQVNITDGPFTGSVAVVSHKKASFGLVCVEVQAFNGSVPMTLDETQVEKV